MDSATRTMRRGAAVLAVASLGFAVYAAGPAPRALPQSSAFAPAADSHVDASRPDRNYGGNTSLRTDASPVVISYLRFDASSATDRSSARLSIYALSSNNLGFKIHTVGDAGWSESAITYNNRPELGPVIAESGPVASGKWYSFNVSSALTADGHLSIALTSPSSTATKYASRESSNGAVLEVPAPALSSHFVVSGGGSTYTADSQTTSTVYTGSLKSVVEAAAHELDDNGGGTVTFTSGVFDFGSEFFELDGLTGVKFEGAGTGETVLQNNSSASTDTEPFDMSLATRVEVRDMTINAGGPLRSTSDAIDFDGATGVVVERVNVIGSRARGIVFDGKDIDGTTPRSATQNTIRDCTITGIPTDGIELLAAQSNTVQGCTITDVGGHGIQLTKSSSSADQPNKKPDDNWISGNTIDNAGQDGINLNGGGLNDLVSNVVTNSSDDFTSRDGIRIGTTDGISCNDNVVSGNTSSDTQATHTQRYGLNIASSLCNRTRVASNVFQGNLVRAINDLGTGTIYG